MSDTNRTADEIAMDAQQLAFAYQELKRELDLNKSMLAKQCDLAREAESKLAAVNQSRDEWVALYTRTKMEVSTARQREREKIAKDWIAANGYDKYGIVEFVRALTDEQADGNDQKD